MSAHVDILDQKEPMAKWFAGSVILHVSVAGALLGYAAFESHFHLNMGSPNGGGFGAVAVNVTNTIPLAQRNAPHESSGQSNRIGACPHRRQKPKPSRSPRQKPRKYRRTQ